MTVASVAPVIAHQGGWDEVAFVALPIALFAGLLALANRRAVRAQAPGDVTDEDDQAPDD